MFASVVGSVLSLFLTRDQMIRLGDWLCEKSEELKNKSNS